MHPLLRLVATQPQLLAEHAESWAALVAAEVGTASQAWGRRALLSALALGALGVAAVLAGVALMLWAVLPVIEPRTAWALWAVPLAPALLGLACGLATRAHADVPAFETLRHQLRADLALLRELAAA